ncbi:MAG: WecB/TagA/CpsF family glycosyltransferase [Candidatus Polarisedimenticolaceae bacterium]|nr:WecB/TagA/CpsF family glycosyltransferase [Candidatus Polarisedimenticolaceae bacterium]
MPDKFDLLGVNISDIDRKKALAIVGAHCETGNGGYICFCNVHTAVMARCDLEYRCVLNQAFLCAPDGKPVYWVGRLKGHSAIQQVAGPDFFEDCFSASEELGLKHYLYGGHPDVLKNLVRMLELRYPKATIVGWESPPFRPLTADEEQEMHERIQQKKPNLIWVGLGAPKQELWMSRHAENLQPAVLLGVGAAFDFHAGAISRAPKWMRYIGLEWFHRLMQEPQRLLRRYVVTNALFLWYLFIDFIGQRKN